MPTDTTVDLSAGSWVVFEQTGTSSRSGQVTTTSGRDPRLTAADVTVTDAAGTPVPDTEITSSSAGTWRRSSPPRPGGSRCSGWRCWG